jgi:hypothetical protein
MESNTNEDDTQQMQIAGVGAINDAGFEDLVDGTYNS